MKIIECFKTSDGRMFEDEKHAEDAENDLIGAELDELIYRIMRMDPGHQAVYRGVLSALKRKSELLACVKRIADVIEFKDDNE